MPEKKLKKFVAEVDWHVIRHLAYEVEAADAESAKAALEQGFGRCTTEGGEPDVADCDDFDVRTVEDAETGEVTTF